MKQGFIKKFLDHPDKDDILSKCINDTSSKEISDWLKEKYGQIGERKFCFTESDISLFKTEYLDLYKHLSTDIATIKKSRDDGYYALSNDKFELFSSIRQNKSYQQRLESYLDDEVDIKKVIKAAVINIQARIEQMYDLIQSNPANVRVDRVLIEWFNLLLNSTEKFDKIVNESPDKVFQHNISVQVVDQKLFMMQEAIRDVLSEFDYETSLMFMNKLNEKLNKLQDNPEPSGGDSAKRLVEAQIISSTLEEFDEK